MRMRKFITSVLLLSLGIALALANLWFTAARSTIPLALDAQVDRKSRLTEKYGKVDDVYLLYFEDNETLQVDADVYFAIKKKARLRKRAWSFQLETGGQLVDLRWSQDLYGMLWAMPLTLAIFIALAVATRDRKPN